MKSSSVIFQFVMEKAADVLPADRIKLYRALAEVIGSSMLARELLSIADALEQIEHSQAQLRLSFSKPAKR